MSAFYVVLYLAVGVILAVWSYWIHQRAAEEEKRKLGGSMAFPFLLIVVLSGIIYAVLFPIFLPSDIRFVIRKAGK